MRPPEAVIDLGSVPLNRRRSGRGDGELSSVFRWRQAYRRKAPLGLAPNPTPGRPPRLAPAEKRQLVKLLIRGALDAGYRTDLWTLPRVTELIHQEFGLRYHPAHVWKVLTALGWSCQKPERRAVERDQTAIARWKREEWPRIRNAARRGARLVFADESGVLLIPNVQRTWAPREQTSCIRHRYRHDRLSVCSGVAVSPKRHRVALNLRCRAHNFTGQPAEYVWAQADRELAMRSVCPPYRDNSRHPEPRRRQGEGHSART